MRSEEDFLNNMGGWKRTEDFQVGFSISSSMGDVVCGWFNFAEDDNGLHSLGVDIMGCDNKISVHNFIPSQETLDFLFRVSGKDAEAFAREVLELMIKEHKELKDYCVDYAEREGSGSYPMYKAAFERHGRDGSTRRVEVELELEDFSTNGVTPYFKGPIPNEAKDLIENLSVRETPLYQCLYAAEGVMHAWGYENVARG